MPASRAVRAIWSASKSVGSKRAGDSSPYPHSLSVKVLMEKWRNPYTSRRCHAVWRELGIAPYGAGGATLPEYGKHAASATSVNGRAYVDGFVIGCSVE